MTAVPKPRSETADPVGRVLAIGLGPMRPWLTVDDIAIGAFAANTIVTMPTFTVSITHVASIHTSTGAQWVGIGDVLPLEVRAARFGEEDSTVASLPLSQPGRPAWYELPGLEGMRLAVQRAKRAARTLDADVEFSSPRAVAVGADEDEEGVELHFAELKVFLPAGSDGRAFRRNYLNALANELSGPDAARLAVLIVERPRQDEPQ
jgi:hypothetical protein